MAVWERYDGNSQITTVGDHANVEVFHNDQGDENFEFADVVGVDGILTVITDTDDLCGVRMIVASNLVTTGDLNENSPAPHERGIWYSFYVGRGPLVFRMRSKKTVAPDHKLWINIWKAQGNSLTSVRWGLHVLWVVKH